ncbi:pyridoxamine 5'-phosphate oxidase family protein [Amnibacterium sp.]|uniref:pyridoxamine 5'-phosphate oxidase family protein n=1 Tax=Amnibacterium sp. TaxID=1872496 RepID=UPI00262D6BFC|nr:pyridoxamine 5'-phosphate oxidase family protein [Amnibacterium sp.]MCU1474050.1 pyridoxamine 5-phosphate oxidase [Amnibacterium sp.]
MEQGDLTLLEEPTAKQLLRSSNPARLGYTWRDGSPRVVAMWFEWSGGKVVMGTPTRAPKLKVLEERPQVALTIDDAGAFPYRELMIRGRAEVELLDDVSPEYARSAVRYFGQEQGDAWVADLRGKPMARISVTPEWVGLLDFETRFPSALT